MGKIVKKEKIKRRVFLKTAGTTAAALSLPVAQFSILSHRSRASNLLDDPRVVTVQDNNAHSGSQIVAEIAQVMMDEAIRRLTGITDIGEAYQSVLPGITAADVIGIKINCINSSLPTHPALVDALINGLRKMTFSGNPFPANNIIIWDRYTSELQSAGYTINTGSIGTRCFSTSSVGYNSMYLNCNGSNQHPSNILTDYCNYLINFGVLKNSSVAGVTFCMKNHYGSIHSPGGMHGGYCNPYTPAINQQIRDVLTVQESLFIIDAIFGCYSGGCGAPPNMVYDGIIIGEDRVAVDAIGRDILDQQGCSTIYMSGHIDTAAEPPYNLGTADLSAINRIDVQNPSMAMTNLAVEPVGQDIVLNWSTPEYTGLIKVLRSTEPDFATYDEIATLNGNSYIDSGVLALSNRYFYRVVKVWG